MRNINILIIKSIYIYFMNNQIVEQLDILKFFFKRNIFFKVKRRIKVHTYSSIYINKTFIIFKYVKSSNMKTRVTAEDVQNSEAKDWSQRFTKKIM